MVQKVFLHVNLQSEKNSAMNFNFKEIATAGMILFAVIDILGSIPVIISLRKMMVWGDLSPGGQKRPPTADFL